MGLRQKALCCYRFCVYMRKTERLTINESVVDIFCFFVSCLGFSPFDDNGQSLRNELD